MAITTLNNRSINRSDTAASGQLWTATSATASDFQAVSAGKIGQVVTTVKTDTTSTTSTSFVDITGMTQAITCAATSSRVLIQVVLNVGFTYDQHINFLLLNGTTGIFLGDAASNRSRSSGSPWRPHSGGHRDGFNMSIAYIDSPSSTSEVTYKLQWHVTGDTGYLNRTHNDTDTIGFGRSASSIICSEILA